LYEEVAERLREFIDARELKPGDRLPSEREIASWLEVSRTSVRQALTALRAIGLVDMRHGGGVYVVRSAEEVIPTLAL
jgi:GntR family transcriptional repressor for pyruvate dehydrogenase complex